MFQAAQTDFHYLKIYKGCWQQIRLRIPARRALNAISCVRHSSDQKPNTCTIRELMFTTVMTPPIAHTTSMRMDARGERQNFLTAPRRNGHGSSQADGTAYFGLLHRVDTSKDVEPALDAAKATGAEAVNILASAFLNGNRKAIFAKATALRLRTIFQWSEGMKDGAFLACDSRQEQAFRQVGQLTGKVLRGTNPADLPIEQPTKFELAVNLKVARELGVTLSPAFLLRADEVIE
jgi:hypothetical protein